MMLIVWCYLHDTISMMLLVWYVISMMLHVLVWYVKYDAIRMMLLVLCY